MNKLVIVAMSLVLFGCSTSNSDRAEAITAVVKKCNPDVPITMELRVGSWNNSYFSIKCSVDKLNWHQDNDR